MFIFFRRRLNTKYTHIYTRDILKEDGGYNG